MKITAVPRRLIYLWQGKTRDLDDVLGHIDIHKIDLALIEKKDNLGEKEASHQLVEFLTHISKKYESERKEPSALVISNAILLASLDFHRRVFC